MSLTKSYRETAAEYNLEHIRNIERPNIILDRKNKEVGRIFVENRAEVPIEMVPQKMIDALVAGEDSRFYTHDGVDYVGISRAVKGNLQTGNADSGASTLTMQLARNAFPLQADAKKKGGDKYDRKFTEIYLAYRIEEKFSKDQIMEFYLNRVPFGSGYYGVRSASLGFFGKEPRDLEVWECASLVGSIKNPSVFSPLRNPERNKKSRNNVLNRMRIEGFISAEECEQYKANLVVTNPLPIERGTSYFYDKVANYVLDTLPEDLREGGGLKIFTTVDKDLQNELEKSIKEQLYLVEKTEGYDHTKYEDFKAKKGLQTKYLQGAGICFNHKTGEVLAYVGGRDFKHSQYDFINAGKRPVGTAFLPFVYAAAVESGKSMSSPLIDEAMDNRMVMVSGQEGILAEWGSETLEPTYEGIIPARQSLAHSKIAATVRLGKEIGLTKVNEVAERMSLTMPRTASSKRLLTRGLIGSESASLMVVSKAYAAIANQGVLPPDLTWVTKIENQFGEVLYEAPKLKNNKQVLSKEVAFFIHSALEDVWKKGNLAESFSNSDSFNFKGGIKTGTSANFADHWAVGYNGDITCGLWAGFFSGSEAIYPGAFAKDIILPAWQSVMKKAATHYVPNVIAQPENVISTLVCARSGLICTPECYDKHTNAVSGKVNYESTGIMELFKKGSEPIGYCDVHGEYNGDISKLEATRDLSTTDLLYVLPVRPQVIALAGNDPYNANIPEYDPFNNNITRSFKRPITIDLFDLGNLDEISTIYQPRPGRIFMDQ